MTNNIETVATKSRLETGNKLEQLQTRKLDHCHFRPEDPKSLQSTNFFFARCKRKCNLIFR